MNNKIKKFYRVSNIETQQGLWYDQKANFTGNIHKHLNFCKHNKLIMDYDATLKGYLSATPTLKTLHDWFPKEDILKLQKHGYFIHEYKVIDYKFYEKCQHFIINQKSSEIIKKIVLK